VPNTIVMKKTFILFALSSFLNGVFAQDEALKSEFKTETIEQLANLLRDNYVFPDIGKATGEHLKMQLNNGHFDKLTTLNAFARALTDEAQSINHDKHMRVRLASDLPPQARPDLGEAGFKEAKILEGNIGYLDLRFFAFDDAKPIADKYLKQIANTDAIIIDLRRNIGGNPRMVQYLCSYFFDKTVHLNSIYYRQQNDTTHFFTIPVNGNKMPTVPLYVLTGKKTFSGGEEFSYNMQTQKRAMLIGQTTGGGANPGGFFPINEQLRVFIPTGKAINPITKTNWEGIGVKPDLIIEEDWALEKALELAKESMNKKNK
jgi:Peptidase family S41/N-terminal domain of Peptidase_S41 in eukaryotic IRBP